MILRFYPTKDTTIYENAPERNTGLDSVLEISKASATGSTGGAATSSFNSRILMDFDYTAISKSIIDLGYDPNLFDFGVKLYATEASETTHWKRSPYHNRGIWELVEKEQLPQPLKGVVGIIEKVNKHQQQHG